MRRNETAFHYSLSHALEREGQKAEASAELQTYLDLQQSHTAAYRARLKGDEGVQLVQSHNLLGAVVSFSAAIEANPNSAQAHNNLGAALSLQGDVSGAVDQFREAIRLDPNYARAHYNLGLALWHAGRRKESRNEFEKAVSLNPNLEPPPEVEVGR